MVVEEVKAGAIIVLVSADPPMLPRPQRPPFRVKQVVVGVELCIANSLLASLRILKIVGKSIICIRLEFKIAEIAKRDLSVI